MLAQFELFMLCCVMLARVAVLHSVKASSGKRSSDTISGVRDVVTPRDSEDAQLLRYRSRKCNIVLWVGVPSGYAGRCKPCDGLNKSVKEVERRQKASIAYVLEHNGKEILVPPKVMNKNTPLADLAAVSGGLVRLSFGYHLGLHVFWLRT